MLNHLDDSQTLPVIPLLTNHGVHVDPLGLSRVRWLALEQKYIATLVNNATHEDHWLDAGLLRYIFRKK